MPEFLTPILPHVVPFLLVLTRLGGLFIFAPVLSSPSIPARVKAMVLLVFAAAVYPSVDASMAPASLHILELAPVITRELVIGAAIGLVASLPLVGMQLGGLLMGQQMGLGIAQVINPATDIEGDNLGQLLFLMAMTGFVLAGGLELLFGAIAESLARVPLGGMPIAQTPLDLVVGVLTSGFELALRVAMPVVVLIFVENIAIGFIMKTVPALNIMNFGFPVRIMLGLVVLVAALAMIRVAAEGELDDTMRTLTAWIRSH